MALISKPSIPEVIYERIKSDLTEFSFNFFQDGVALDVSARTYKIRLKASGIQALDKAATTNTGGHVTFTLLNSEKATLLASEYQLFLVEILESENERTILSGTLRWFVSAGRSTGLVSAADVSINYIAATDELMVAMGITDFGSLSSAASAAVATAKAQQAIDAQAAIIVMSDQVTALHSEVTEDKAVVEAAVATIDQKLSDADAISKGSKTAIPTDTPDPGVLTYLVSTVGTYTNFGGLVVTSGDLTSGRVELRKEGGFWKKVITPLALDNYAQVDEVYYPEIGQEQYGRSALSGSTALSVDRTRIEGTAVTHNGKLNTLRAVCMVAGAGKIKFLSKNVDGTFNFQKEFSYNFAVGENVITSTTFGPDFTIAAGWHLAVYGSVAQFASLNTGAVSGDVYTYVGDLTGANQTAAAASTKLNFIALIDYTIAKDESIKDRLADARTAYGRSSLSLQTALSTNGTRIEPNVFTKNGFIEYIEAYFNVGGLGNFKVLQRNADGTYNFISEFEVNAKVGYNKFYPNEIGVVPVVKGQCLAFKGSVAQISAQSSAGASLMYSYTGDLLGTNIAVTITNSQLQIKASVSPITPVVRSGFAGAKSKDNELAASIADKTAVDGELIKDKVTEAITPYGRSGISLLTALSTNGTRIEPNLFTVAGYLQYVEAYFNVAGTGLLKILTRNGDGTYSFVAQSEVVVAAGYNKLSAADFGVMPVAIGQCLAFKGITAQISAQSEAGGSMMYNFTGDLLGANQVVAATNSQLQIKASVSKILPMLKGSVSGLKALSTALAARIALLENNPADSTFKLGLSAISKTRFAGTTTPTGWTLGGWTVNNGLRSPAVGDYTAKANFDSFTAATAKTTRAYFTINSLTSVFAVCFTPFLTNFDSGTLAIIDAANSQLRLINWDGLAIPAGGTTTAFSFTTGRKYLVEVIRIRFRTIFKVTDTVTQASAIIDRDDINGAPRSGRQWGKAGVVFIAGSGAANDVTVHEFGSYLNARKTRKLGIASDSNTEFSAGGVDYNKGYAYMIQDARKNNDVVVVSRAGDNTENLLLRMAIDITFLAAEYFLVPMGTNDTSASTWATNMTSILAAITAAGSKPILATLLPRLDGADAPANAAWLAKNIAINNIIRSGALGGYSFDYIDFAKAVSLNHDGVTVDPDLYISDLLHLSVAGHAKLFQQVKIDAPYLLEED